ncbi:MAG: glycoside hydrolase family 3 C-terminal domain-containing protein [Chitinophagaceae bacterium]|nr:glycoside hydrolase family 3 C-terminal domain-containing protein [Chitinophagaceae bacterium]
MHVLKNLGLILLFSLSSIPVIAQQDIPDYKNASLPAETRVRDLLKRMTLKEKLAQLTEMSVDVLKQENNVWKNALSFDKLKDGIGCLDGFSLSGNEYARRIKEVQEFLITKSRLGIPALPVSEALHGWVQDGATIFPQAIGMGATFNPDLIRQVGAAIGKEIASSGVKQALFPDLDLGRDPRWGRVEETYGEDPFLVSSIGVAMIKGFQEGDQDDRQNGLICTVKHFYGQSSPLGGLNIASTKGGNYDLFNFYLKPFEAAVKKAGVFSLMSSYVTYDGIPTNANRNILTGVLRNRWGFKGFVYSDWGAVEFLKYIHRFAETEADAAQYAIEAGVDIEAPAPRCFQHLDSLVKNNIVPMAVIDTAVSRVLYVKFKTGLFEHPYPDLNNLNKEMHTRQNIELSRRVANESLVLLKNENGILPLDKNKIKSIAVIGPNADQVQFGDYSWTRNNKDGVTLLAGLKKLLGSDVKINYAPGCKMTSMDTSGFREAMDIASKSDIVILAIGTASGALSRNLENATCGEGFDVDDLRPTGAQYLLARRLINSGKKVITVLITGRPLDISFIQKRGDAVLCAWYPGERGGEAIADALFGKVDPSGKLPISFPRSTGQIPVFYNYLPSDRGYYHKPGNYDKSGRDYVFDSTGALYPFGFGLSYAHFTISNMKANEALLDKDDTLRVTLDIKNDGVMDGGEVVQLYMRRDYAPVMTPIKELKGFKKVFLKKGESKKVILSVPIKEFTYYDNEGNGISLKGSYKIMVGNSSNNIIYNTQIRVE